MANTLPIPSFFNAQTVGEVWRVPYLERAAEAQTWATQHGIKPAATDKKQVCLMAMQILI